MIGETISHYKILEVLGQGGMGTVYRSLDTHLDRDVALKVLSQEAVANPERKRRFVQEAKAASALSHPNIVTIHDIDAVATPRGTVDFIAMEYVRGKTLEQRMGPAGMPLVDVLRCATQIASALAAAHRAGIVHRDLKPANLMVTDDGLVKVLDFGIAKLLAPTHDSVPASTADAAVPPRTVEGSVLGTIYYMSPEQAQARKVDARSDIFSFGSVVYELLAGRKPFRGDSDVAILSAILRDEPAPLGELAPGVPQGLDETIRRCLQKNPEDRFQSAGELQGEIERLYDAYRPTTDAGIAARHVPRRRKLWVPAAAAAAIFLAVLLVPSWRERISQSLTLRRIPVEKRIAVLPFQNVGGEPAHQAFCDGLVETLTSALTQLEQFHGSLSVVPASEVRKESIDSARAAQKAFGVNLVVTGSAQRTGEHVRLTTNLVDARTLQQLGARTLDARLEELPALQDSVVRQVAGLLAVQLAPQAQRALAQGGTTVPTAYDFYLQGRGHMQRFDRPAYLGQAIRSFEQALRLDNRYALAHAGMAQAYLREYSRTKDAEWLERAQAAARQASDLDPLLAQAHVQAGAVHAVMGRHEEAIRAFRRALDLDATNADANRELGRVYTNTGRHKEAEDTLRRAIQLRPNLWLGHMELGAFYIRRARYADAEAAFHRVTEIVPDSYIGYQNLGAVYLYMGRYPEAEEMLKQSLAIQPTNSAYSNLGTHYFAHRRYREAAQVYQKAAALEPNDHRMWGNLGDACRWAPELSDKAPEAYRRAIQAAERQLAVNPDNAGVLASVALFSAKLGDTRRAADSISKARRLAPSETAIGFKAVLVYEIVGQRDRALSALEEILRRQHSLAEVEADPELAQLRKDPRYARLGVKPRSIQPK